MKFVDVLGTRYVIRMDVSAEDMPEDADGCVDVTTHKIKIAKMEPDKNSVQDMEAYKKKVLRHEIIHAFFYESGIWNSSGSSECWGMDEQITDWMAIQSPKLFQAFKEAGCI